MNKYFSDLLVEARTEKKLTQKQVAELVGVGIRTYQSWEYNERIPDAQNLLKLIKTLDLNLEDVNNSLK